MRSWRLRRVRAPRAHFLHIGKAGGSAIKAALEGCEGAYQLVLHGHATTLKQVPRGDRFFFVLRDPVERFVSGFYSRQRQGRPRYNSPWSSAEARAFALFSTAESLACGLSSQDDEERSQAEAAMRSIQHVRDSYWTWFRDDRYFEHRLDDLLAVLWLPDLDATFPQLSELLGIAPAPALPHDDLTAHRNPAALDRELSSHARTVLEQWYAADQAFVNRCRKLPSFLNPSSAEQSDTAPIT
jgi:hypothetical protein